MARPITRKSANVLMIVESILNLIVLPLGLATVGMAIVPLSSLVDLQETDQAAIEELEAMYDPDTAALMTFLFLLVFAAARALRGYRLREKKGKGFLRLSFAQAAVFVIAGALPIFIGFSLESTSLISILIALALIAGRVYAIVRNHRFRNVIFSIIGILGIILCAIGFVYMSALLFLLAIFALMSIVFSRISFSVLREIIAKTHAAEIIFGMILLIVTFAMLLTFFEPNMDKFTDALWYCFAIVTTIGFGDLTAVTDFGRILSVILGAYGIVVVALITSIIVNFYGEMKTSSETAAGGAAESQEEKADAKEPE